MSPHNFAQLVARLTAPIQADSNR
eukprot:COSAG01_NODE_73796_length_236_cov_3.627737_1_plen_23_part_10